MSKLTLKYSWSETKKSILFLFSTVFLIRSFFRTFFHVCFTRRTFLRLTNSIKHHDRLVVRLIHATRIVNVIFDKWPRQSPAKRACGVHTCKHIHVCLAGRLIDRRYTCSHRQKIRHSVKHAARYAFNHHTHRNGFVFTAFYRIIVLNDNVLSSQTRTLTFGVWQTKKKETETKKVRDKTPHAKCTNDVSENKMTPTMAIAALPTANRIQWIVMLKINADATRYEWWPAGWHFNKMSLRK